MANIPSGYQLQITSWENDGDHYTTTITNGLTKEDCKFIIDVCKLFVSASDNTGGYGNRGCTEAGDQYHYSCSKDVLDSVACVLVSSDPNISVNLRDEFVNAVLGDIEILHDLMTRYLGYTTDYQDFDNFFRVFDYAKVYYFPEEVLDLSEQFN